MSRFTDKTIEEKISSISNDDQKTILPWNKGIGIKALIITPSLFFLVGFFILNTPHNFKELIVILIYPVLLISLGVILFLSMNK